MSLRWYSHYMEDYDRDTRGLTMLQHGAYRMLLDECYRTERPLPAGLPVIHMIARAVTKGDKAAVSLVLNQFFTLSEDGWHNRRVDEELAKAGRLKDAKAAAGSLGGRSKWGASKDHRQTRAGRLAAARTKGAHTPEQWLALVAIFRGVCIRCKAQCDRPVKDHIIPIYKGGSDAIENLQPLCISCNSAKGPEETDWREGACHNWRDRLAERLADASQTPAHFTPTDTSLEPNGSKQKSAAAPVVPKPKFVLPDWVPKEAWDDYATMRGAKFTIAARKKNLDKLTALRSAGEEPEAVLSQSVERGWSGLFPVKPETSNGAGQRQSTAHENLQRGTLLALERLERRGTG